jgi:pilus assembly protein CpaE
MRGARGGRAGSTDELTAALQQAGVKLPATGHGVSHDLVPPDARQVRGGKVLVFVGAPRGAAGMTRVAIESGTALGRRDKTLLVDAVPREPSFAAALALNPARNLTAVAAATPGSDPVRWARALAEWGQPLDQSSPHAAVLAGVPTAAMRGRLSPSFLAELLRQASAPGAFAYVVVDAGAEPPPDTFEGACWRALVDTADHVLLVTVPDTAGVARACETLKRLAAAVPVERLGVVLNRYRKGEHDEPDEVAALMGVPVVAVVPQDERACTRALRAQRPLLTLGRNPAAREFLRFADRVRATQVTAVERWWRRWLPARLRTSRGH